MRQSRTIMGMPVLLEIVDAGATQKDYDAIFDYFTEVDEQFSTYKDTSEVSKINQGILAPESYGEEVKEVFTLAEKTQKETDGYFDIHTPAGTIDPSGIVKGWAITSAAKKLTDAGWHNFYVEIAGDIQTSGVTAEGEEWSIGIRNPFARDEIVKVVYPHGKGIATSGDYIRGNHIYNPHATDQTPSDFVSLTVIGPTVYDADRFATAAFAMGKEGLYFLENLEGYEAYAIDANGIATMTTGFITYTTP